MKYYDLLLPWTFLAVVIATFCLLYFSIKPPRPVLILILIWLMFQSLLARSGFYVDITTMPPRFALAIGPPFIFIIYLFVFRRNALIANSSLKHLTLLHTIRIAVELVLFGLFKIGEIPELMTFEGSNPDILSGITAPLAWAAYQYHFIGKKGLLIWNIACLVLLFNIVVRALLSAPTPFQQFAFEQPNVAVLKFPYVLLPAFVVPAVLFSHIAAITKLFRSISHDNSV